MRFYSVLTDLFQEYGRPVAHIDVMAGSLQHSEGNCVGK